MNYTQAGQEQSWKVTYEEGARRISSDLNRTLKVYDLKGEVHLIFECGLGKVKSWRVFVAFWWMGQGEMHDEKSNYNNDFHDRNLFTVIR